jgi:beta-lactam-binding protein with PASTA domain
MENNSMERQKNFLEDLTRDKPESFQEEVFEPAPRKLSRYVVPLIGILAAVIILILFSQLSKTTVPDMTGWQLDELQSWAKQHHENTKMNGVYTKEQPANLILSQDVSSGKRINKSKILTVTYSLGADPEEIIPFPELKTMNLTQIKGWINDNQMSGVTIKYEASEVTDKDAVISYEFIEGSEEEFRRKNRMLIYISSGANDVNETFKMEDFYGKTKAEVLQWAKEHAFKVTIQEEFNENIEYGKVYEQNIKKDTKITRTDEVVITISRGASIEVPAFEGMSRSEASELAALYGIKLFFRLIVSKEEVDQVLRQDIKAGTEIDQKQIVTLQVAKKEGKNLVPNFTGLTASEANSLAGLYGIKTFLKNAAKAGENGVVTSQSIAAGEQIDEDHILTLKLDINIAVPDFVGLTKNEALLLADKLGLTLITEEIEASSTPNQTVISQNIKPKTRLETGASLILKVSVNSGIRVRNLSSMKLKDAQAWAAKNGINLNVIDYYSGDYQAGTLYEQDCSAGSWIPVSKVLTVYRSLGLVMAENYIGKTKAEMLQWRDEVNSKGADIQLTFTADTDTSKEKGVITGQNVYGELVKLDKTINVTVSATDQGVLIKEFEGKDLDDFKLWCDTNSVKYIIRDCYSDTVEEGVLFGQNYKGTYLPKGEYLRINHSLGKVYVKDFTNQTKSSMIEWQKEVNKKMADIKLVFAEEYSSTVERGRIIGQVVKDTEINLDSTIVVTVSKGN